MSLASKPGHFVFSQTSESIMVFLLKKKPNSAVVSLIIGKILNFNGTSMALVQGNERWYEKQKIYAHPKAGGL